MGSRNRPPGQTFLEHWDDFQSVQRLRDLRQVEEATGRFARSLGFETHGFAHKAIPAPGTAGDALCIFHNHRTEFSQWYGRLRLPGGPDADARVIHARMGLPAIAWNVLGQFNYMMHAPALLALARPQVRVAGEFNMRGGITLPGLSRRAEWCFLTLATDATRDVQELGTRIGTALYFLHCLQVSIDRLTLGAMPLPVLSPRELEILRWTALGKTSWEISCILKIAERTVNFHLQNAARKLGTVGRRASCARAVALGLVAL